jgi:hypothetical protein
MITYTYKLQGDGRDSWVKIETDERGLVVNKCMVYEDPNAVKKTDASTLDIDSLTDEQILRLKERLK